jgi:hypothetical protein
LLTGRFNQIAAANKILSHCDRCFQRPLYQHCKIILALIATFLNSSAPCKQYQTLLEQRLFGQGRLGLNEILNIKQDILSLMMWQILGSIIRVTASQHDQQHEIV